MKITANDIEVQTIHGVTVVRLCNTWHWVTPSGRLSADGYTSPGVAAGIGHRRNLAPVKVTTGRARA